jgi:hypothetical protein
MVEHTSTSHGWHQKIESLLQGRRRELTPDILELEIFISLFDDGNVTAFGPD